MTFYLIGLGLNEESLSIEAKGIICNSKEVYLETYTVTFPYSIEALEKVLGKKVIPLKREEVEGEEFINSAREEDVCLLVYGSPLSATTHNSLIEKCKVEKIPYRVLYNGSVMDAIAESGLQLYKFGKVASMPRWTRGKYEPDSFIEIIKDNKKINAHSLLLIDIGLECEEALEQLMQALKKKKEKVDEILICSRLGTKDKKILYGRIEELINKASTIKEPFCFIIPAQDLHFAEEEIILGFR